MFGIRKLQYLYLFIVCTTTLFLSTCVSSKAQNITKNKYGLLVINKVGDYYHSVATDSLKKLINISNIIPEIKLDLRYNTTNNFTHQKIYHKATTTFLRLPAVNALAKVEKELAEKGLGLKIWDAYRPYAATEFMWELVKDDRYAANPAKGSGHNRGIAVDLTIINKNTGEELTMGTGFDNFSDTAHHDFKPLPETVLNNRKLLRAVMEKYGFKALETEWWHYYWADGKEYEVMNLSFKELKKLKL